MRKEVISELVNAYHTNNKFLYYAFKSGNGIEPLAAIYTAEGINAGTEMFKSDIFSQIGPSQWLKTEKALILKTPLDECFANMNYPEDLT